MNDSLISEKKKYAGSIKENYMNTLVDSLGKLLDQFFDKQIMLFLSCPPLKRRSRSGTKMLPLASCLFEKFQAWQHRKRGGKLQSLILILFYSYFKLL